MKIIDEIYNKQREYGYIKSFNISRRIIGEECSEFNLQIILSDYPNWQEDKQFNITFLGIKELKLGCIENLYKIRLDIQNIADRQLEGIKYSIQEDENDLFSFFCSNIEIS